MSCIYGLFCPEGKLRYVGYTTKDVDKRLSAHIYESTWPKTAHLRKSRWITSLRSQGLLPTVRVLRHLDPDENWKIAETFAIAAARADGHDLCNLTAGGDGLVGADPEVIKRIAAANKGRKTSAESLAIRVAKQTGLKRTQEFRDACSARKKGIPPIAAIKASADLRRGVKLTPDVCARIGAGHIGLRHTKESKEKMQEAAKLRPDSHYVHPPISDETRDKMRKIAAARSPEYYTRIWEIRRANAERRRICPENDGNGDRPGADEA